MLSPSRQKGDEARVGELLAQSQDPCLFSPPQSTLPQGSTGGFSADVEVFGEVCRLEVFLTHTAPLVSQQRGALLSVHVGHMRCGSHLSQDVGVWLWACQRCSSPQPPKSSEAPRALCTLDNTLVNLDSFLSLRELQPLEKSQTGPVSEEVWGAC